MEDRLVTLDWEKGCSIGFDFETGMARGVPIGKRRLSEMRGMFFDADAYEGKLAEEDPVVYEYHALDIPQTPGDISFGFSILMPGRVGNEYYFTKGHFHNILDTAEMYLCTRGRGCLLIESKAGDCRLIALAPGCAGYVPKGYAHRSINISDSEPFITLFTYRADAGHDYATSETKGFRKLLVCRDGVPALIDNPRWIEK